MRGELLGVWEFSWQELWQPLSEPLYVTEDKGWYTQDSDGKEIWEDETPEYHDDLFCELFRALNSTLKEPYDEATELADIVDNASQARDAFQSIKAESFKGESSLRDFFEQAYTILDEVYESENLKRKYTELLEIFIQKYSLRYALRKPFILVPTLPGIFASMLRECQNFVSHDSHLMELASDFEEALKTFRLEQTPQKLKECLRVQVNLMEGIGCLNPSSNGANTYGQIIQKLVPHEDLTKAVKGIYKFINDYPGIRHGGTPNSRLRELELRDLLVVSLQLYSCLPYLSENLEPEKIYGGSVNP